MKSTPHSLNISLIGAGKVGTTLSAILRRSGNNIVAVVSRDERSARVCGRLVGCRNCADNISIIPPSTNLVLIAVPDRSIRSIAESLAQLQGLDFAHLIVCHTSGALTSDELAPLFDRGARVLSLHPIQTFPKHKSMRDQVRTMSGISYGIEGPKQSLAVAKKLVKQLGGNALVVPKDAKILYHCACVIASNYAVTLVGAIEALAAQLTSKGLAPFRPLLETSISNALDSGARKALTGPIVRGDEDIISRHLKSISDADLRTVYKSLGIYALKLAIEDGRIGLEPAQRIQRMLKESE